MIHQSIYIQTNQSQELVKSVFQGLEPREFGIRIGYLITRTLKLQASNGRLRRRARCSLKNSR